MRRIMLVSLVLAFAGCVSPTMAARAALARYQPGVGDDDSSPQPVPPPPPVDDGFARLQQQWQERDEQQRAHMQADSQRQLEQAQQSLRDEQQRQAEDAQRRAQQEQAEAANAEWLQREQQLLLTPSP